MDFFQALILGILQGITEFLPISSSGHLVLGEAVLGLDVEALKSFDVAVHMGTLVAIIIYFWKDLVGLIMGFLSLIRVVKPNKKHDEYHMLILFIVIGSVPAVLVGFLLGDAIDYWFRNTLYVGLFMIIIAELFIVAEGKLKKFKKPTELKLGHAIIIGCFQALALIPGVSRSGSTIAAGIFQGISREKAARFSFLMAMPVIFGAGMLTVVKELRGGELTIELMPMVVGFIASAAAGFASVYFLMKFLKNHTLKVFSVYLFIVGAISVIISIL
ncbi:undecaprenyl-diphosphatase UppP [Patescibacteria group bacterium]